MKILAIETSCDETAVSLLDITGPLSKPEVSALGNALLSQTHVHKEYGGVYPSLAKREHEKNLPILLAQCLKEAGEDIEAPQIDYIAVTQGPGLEPALWVGITFAEELGQRWAKPVVPVNHMAGHIYSVLYGASTQLVLPALALLVSGGHTELVLVKDFNNYKIIGQTRDDAVGEAFDKVARMLGLPFPGGPKISALASLSRERGGENPITLPRPMIHSKDLNFSYSGLKTAVLYLLKSLGEVSEETKSDIAREFEDAAIEVLVNKTTQALTQHDEVKTLIVGGGVSANVRLREEIENLKINFPYLDIRLPEESLSTDNAIMIGIAAYITMSDGWVSKEELIKAKGNLSLTKS